MVYMKEQKEFIYLSFLIVLIYIVPLHFESGDPERIRTSDLQFRKLLLYPAELRGLAAITTAYLTYSVLNTR